jgi:hypothetical protein
MAMQDRTVAFEDDHIEVELLYFAPHSGTAQVLVREKHDRVGFYYIWVNFTSGDSTRIDYDGGNPSRVQALEIHTTHRDDSIKEIVVKRVRD